jgi:uncharacterized protein YbjT (DUF2867 family)
MKTALVFGSTGLIGGHLTKLLLENSNYEKVKLFVRSNINLQHPKLQIIKIDFKNLSKHTQDIKGDDCFFCIGTTRKNSPNKQDYQRIELDIPKQISSIAKSNSVNSFSFISSGMANSKHSGDYLRFKGLVEEELQKLNFNHLSILRPSFLLGKRKENRIGERLGIFVFKLLSPFFIGSLKRMKPIDSEIVARAMIHLSNNNVGKNIFESDEIFKLGKI